MEARHTVLALLKNIAEGQTDMLVMRTVLFRFLRETHTSHPADDYVLRFKLLYSLTNTGKDIKCFEEEVCLLNLSYHSDDCSHCPMIYYIVLV